MKKYPGKHGGPHNCDHALVSQPSADTDVFFYQTNVRICTLPSQAFPHQMCNWWVFFAR